MIKGGDQVLGLREEHRKKKTFQKKREAREEREKPFA